MSLVFTLPNGITINTRYIESIGPVIWEEGLGNWSYAITNHRGETVWAEFNNKPDAQLNRDRLISTIEHK